RDFHVTGVQTCALPIYEPEAARRRGCRSAPLQVRLRLAPSEEECQDKIYAAVSTRSTRVPATPVVHARSVHAGRGSRPEPPDGQIGRASCREVMAGTVG